MKEITVVKRNLLFAKQLLHADYDAKVGGRAMDLYCSINDRYLSFAVVKPTVGWQCAEIEI